MIILIVLISLSVLILVHELGHFLTAKFFGVRVHEFGFGFPPKILGKKVGETTYSLNLLPFGGFVKIHGEDGEEIQDKRSFAVQSVGRRSVIVLAGVFMNVFLGWLILSAVFAIGSPRHLAIGGVGEMSPANKANIKGGDVVLEATFNSLVLKDPIRVNEFIALVKEAGENTVNLKIKRGDTIFDVSLRGRTNPPSGQGSLGLSLVEIGFAREPLLKSFAKGAIATFETLKMVSLGFLNFFSRLFVTPQIIETVTGPIGIFTLAAQAGSLGIVYLLELIAFISINLAVLNLIPFPALDGGRFLFLLVEKIKGSPIPRKFQMVVNAIGFVALIILMVIVTVKDITRIL